MRSSPALRATHRKFRSGQPLDATSASDKDFGDERRLEKAVADDAGDIREPSSQLARVANGCVVVRNQPTVRAGWSLSEFQGLEDTRGCSRPEAEHFDRNWWRESRDEFVR